MRASFLICFFTIVSISTGAGAQQGYEFEVYGPRLVEKGATEFELHTNFVPSGARRLSDEDGKATHHALRSSFEISHGITSWLAASVYVVGYARRGDGLSYVGNRGRLTAAAPKSWNLPFDLGLSNEVGFARKGFAEHQWALELTPILGKSFGPISLVFNPALERGLSGQERVWELEPRALVQYALGEDEGVGIEYYSVLGPVTAFDSQSHQRHQILLTGSAEVSRGFEGTLALGRGLTANTDKWVIMTRFEYKIPR